MKVQEKEKAKRVFKEMLSEYEFINTQMRFKNLIPIFQGDPWWQLLDESEREKEFQVFLKELYEREKEYQTEELQRKTNQLQTLFLQIPNLSADYTWQDI